MVHLLNAILAALACLSLALALWQWFAARRFPLHRRVADSSVSPAITLLKPLKNCDETTPASLASWFSQKYAGPVQILFGVADANDPVCPTVRELIRQNPGCDAQLVVCENLAGANAKVAKLVQLEKLAKHDLILVSDADVRVPPDFFANIVAPLTRPAATLSPPGWARGEFGLVCCFYRLANPATPAMLWEAVAVNADFWSQVLQAVSFRRLDFALGAVMLTRRKLLAEIGGFHALADCLADDYQLGHRLAQKGHRLALSPVVVECWDAPMSWRAVWRHQLRWARTIRVCQPLPYFFSILSNATLWPLLWLAMELSKSTPVARTTDYGFFQTSGIGIGLTGGMIAAIAFLLVRIIVAQNLQRDFTPEKNLVSPFWFVPVKDLLQVALWLGAFAGNTVEWRGRRMRLRRDGTLVEK